MRQRIANKIVWSWKTNIDEKRQTFPRQFSSITISFTTIISIKIGTTVNMEKSFRWGIDKYYKTESSRLINRHGNL